MTMFLCTNLVVAGIGMSTTATIKDNKCAMSPPCENDTCRFYQSSKSTANPPKGDEGKGTGLLPDGKTTNSQSSQSSSASPGREFTVTHKGRET